ncbi:hypothetical protein HDU76_013871 [Blyttiomyces sp. JEL0837]|nr:hypothetical protein HDU76_013871 [Blyttiomyces sp. JEL0837]
MLQSKEFFTLVMDEKEKLAWDTPESNRGYVFPGRERIAQSFDAEEVAKLRETSPDLKETIQFGKEPSKFINKWPTHKPSFRPTMMEFFETLHNLNMEVMRSIALGLGLDEKFFDPYCNGKDNILRLLHYPTVEKTVLDRENQTRTGAHTDYGSITLLFQDDKGGLEVKTADGIWAPATPIPGTVVVNAADLLTRWSNDVIKSTEHRVVSPPPSSTTAQTTTYPDRYSIAYFCTPNDDALIECLPDIGGTPKYGPVTTTDYITMRLRATY